MAAYAALVSVMHIIDQIQNHPRPPISLHQLQAQSLTEKVTLLQHFLESYSTNGDDHVLESRIADAAYAAEDIIESHVVHQITQAHALTTSHMTKMSGSIDFYQDLEKVIQEMDLIKTEVTMIKEKTKVQDQHHRISTSAASLNSSTTESKGKNTMVGLDDVKIDLMDKLVTGQQSHRQIIPIVGMGGIGKTTLARNIYESSLIVQHFDILAWTTISQQHSAKEILLQVLDCLKTCGSRETLSEMSEHELGDKLHKSLIGRRYLIVMDDMWSIEPWYSVRLFFPDNEDGSRIMITTRLSNLACELTGSNGLEMDFLDEDKSWDLLCKNVDCPLELEEIGRKIAKNCKGLPLSIVVIGGLLAKTKGTREHWQYIEENLNTIVKLEDNEHCSKILQMSYNQLPIHLKPCFLYMGVYPEDHEIQVSDLMKLWVAEGFLKPISGKSLEEVAEEYFNDLVDRNLILVSERKNNGKIRIIKIHDLLMDLCVRESRKGKFLYLTKQHKLGIISRDMLSTQRRIVVQDGTSPEIIDALPCASLVRSLTRTDTESFPELQFNYSLLRVWQANDIELSPASARGLVNCRYIDGISIRKTEPEFPSAFSLFWNLQILFLYSTVPSEFWKSSQLRHVKLCGRRHISLPDPPPNGDDDDDDDDFVLTNLQTLKGGVRNFKCSAEVVKRIPNIKTLRLWYSGLEEWASSNFNNLSRLHKLKSLCCEIHPESVPSVGSEFVRTLTFPHSLIKLTLDGTKLQWEDITTKIGLLPHLQVLKLNGDSVQGPEWETVEGQFCSLKCLKISNCRGLKNWKTESTHFPCLEHIVFEFLWNLKEIPLDIGEITTLQFIELNDCSDSSIISAKEIVNEQEALGNEALQVRVQLWEENEELESLASTNFLI